MTKRTLHNRESPAIAAVDLGRSKVACIVASLEPVGSGAFEPEILGVAQYGLSPSEADARGLTSAVEQALRAALEASEHMAGARARDAYVAVGGRSIHSRRLGVDLETAGCVTAEDVADCFSAGAAEARRSAAGFVDLDVAPIRYFADGELCRGAPEGHVADLLTAELLALSVRESVSANLEGLLARCGLDVAATIAAPQAAGEATLIEDEKELGVVLLDIGARETDVAVYERGALIGCGAVKLGGEHVTRDVAQIFGAPLADAERIKTLYGGALRGGGDEHRLIDFPQLGDPSEIARHSRAELCAVIAPRLDEILEMAGALAENLSGGRKLIRRAVLTGGGALTLGALEAAERVLGVKTRLGRPQAIAGAPEAATAPQFAVAAGVVQHAARLQSSPKRSAYASAPRAQGGFNGAGAPRLIAGVGAWLRDHF